MAERVRLAGGVRRSAAQQQQHRGLVEQRRELILDSLPVGDAVDAISVARDLGLAVGVVAGDLAALLRRGRVERDASGWRLR